MPTLGTRARTRRCRARSEVAREADARAAIAAGVQVKGGAIAEIKRGEDAVGRWVRDALAAHDYTYVRRADISLMNRGDAAAATWIFL